MDGRELVQPPVVIVHDLKKKPVITWPNALTSALLKCFKNLVLEHKIISYFGSETPQGVLSTLQMNWWLFNLSAAHQAGIWYLLSLIPPKRGQRAAADITGAEPSSLSAITEPDVYVKPPKHTQNRYHPGNLLFWLHPSGSTSIHLKCEASCFASLADSRLCESRSSKHVRPPHHRCLAIHRWWRMNPFYVQRRLKSKSARGRLTFGLRLLGDTSSPSDVRLTAEILQEFQKSIWWVTKTSALGGIQMLKRTGASAWLKQRVSEQSGDKQRGRKRGINRAERNKRWWESQQGVSLWLCRIKRITKGEVYDHCSC